MARPNDHHMRLMLAFSDPLATANGGERIIEAGSVPAFAGLVVTGWACRIMVWPDGARQIVGIVLPGDVFGLDGLVSRSNHAVEALNRMTFRPCAVQRPL